MKKKNGKKMLMVNKKAWITICLLSVGGIALYGCGNEQNTVNTQSVTEVTTTEHASEEKTEFDGFGISSSAEETVPTAVRVGDVAPDFTLELVDGSIFTLSEQKGKVVLLNFWSSWCGPCVREMPAFERLYQEYGEELKIVAIDGLEYRERMDKFLESTDYTFPFAFDEDSVVNMMYPSDGIPYTVIIDQEGIVQNTYVGAADADQQYEIYKSAIDTLLKQE